MRKWLPEGLSRGSRTIDLDVREQTCEVLLLILTHCYGPGWWWALEWSEEIRKKTLRGLWGMPSSCVVSLICFCTSSYFRSFWVSQCLLEMYFLNMSCIVLVASTMGQRLHGNNVNARTCFWLEWMFSAKALLTQSRGSSAARPVESDSQSISEWVWQFRPLHFPWYV